MSDSDIAAIITAETDDFSGPILEAQATAGGFFSRIVDGGSQALDAMTASLAEMASEIATGTKAALVAAANAVTESFLEPIAAAGAQAAESLGQIVVSMLGGFVDVGKGVITGILTDLGLISAKAAIAGTAVVGTTGYFAGLWNTMRVGLQVTSWFVPWLKAITVTLTAASIAVAAFQATDAALNSEMLKSTGALENTRGAFAEFKDQLASTGETLGIVGSGVGSWSEQIKNAMGGVASGAAQAATSLVDELASGALTYLNESIERSNAATVSLIDAYADWRSTAGATAAELRDLAKSSEELIAKQTAMSSITGQIRAMQDEAAASAAHSAEMQRIGSLDNVQAVNEEINALQQKSAALAQAAVEGAAAQAKLDAMKPPSEEDNVGRGKAEALRKIAEEGEAAQESLKKTGALFTALENQRNKIESGGMDKKEKASAGESAIAQAEQALRRLTLGQDEAAISALIAEGATQKEIDTLRELQAEIAEVNAAEQQRAQMERDVAEAVANAQREAQQEADARQRLTEQGESQIQGMLDQIDLLTGAATKAEIEMRKMARAGFSQEQIDEVGALQAELDALEEGKQKTEGDKSPSLKAAFRGSQEAASIMLRGVGGPKTMEQIANKQLNVQQQTLIAIKANKPPDFASLTV